MSNKEAKLLAYRDDPSKFHLAELIVAYDTLLSEAQRQQTALRPGLYADYAVCLALFDHKAEANKMFNNEVALFPQSQLYVRALKSQLLPDYADDTAFVFSAVKMDVDPYLFADSATLANRDPKVVRAEEERKKNEQKALEQARKQALRDSIAQAKEQQRQWKADERRRQQELRAAEKEAQAAEREEAKRLKQQQRDEAKRLKALQRDEAKQRKMQEREAARRAADEAQKQNKNPDDTEADAEEQQ